MPSSYLILCHPLLLLPSIFSSIRVFSNELVLHVRWLKYWSISFSISRSNDYSVLISFRNDWFDLLAVQRTVKNLLSHHGSKASVLQYSAFFMVQLSHLCMTTGKTIALTIWTFVGKVMFLLFNTSRFVIVFKGISVFEFHGCSHCPQWFWSLVVWIQIYKKIKCHCFNFSPFYLPWIDGTRCYDLSFLNIEF